MNKVVFAVLTLISLFSSGIQAQIVTCPDPQSSSLKWGEPPEPWVVSPYSPNHPQGEAGTRFVRANILVAGMGRGAVCTYQNSVGLYTIWWEAAVKIPSRQDYNWIESYGGYVCTESLASCQFSIAIE